MSTHCAFERVHHYFDSFLGYYPDLEGQTLARARTPVSKVMQMPNGTQHRQQAE